jgi:hypothetical protein
MLRSNGMCSTETCSASAYVQFCNVDDNNCTSPQLHTNKVVSYNITAAKPARLDTTARVMMPSTSAHHKCKAKPRQKAAYDAEQRLCMKPLTIQQLKLPTNIG